MRVHSQLFLRLRYNAIAICVDFIPLNAKVLAVAWTISTKELFALNDIANRLEDLVLHTIARCDIVELRVLPSNAMEVIEVTRLRKTRLNLKREEGRR